MTFNIFLASFQVSFKGKAIQVENLTLSYTIRELKEYLTEAVGIPVEFQKLFYKGLLDNDASTLRECNFKTGIKVLLVGSSQQDIQAVKTADSKVIHQQSKYAVNPYKNIKRIESSFNNKYTFNKIEVIEHFPNSDRARAFLEKLRDDRGIRGIMSHYKWSVGILQELNPAEKTILGFNRNAGQLISLRLRTDDMQGFRHYPVVRRTLLHELAHNIWSEHDDNFHRLNRQLNKDVVSMDWTTSKSYKISNAEFYNPSEEETIETCSWEGGRFVLGGDSSRVNTLPMRDLLAEAALIRITKEEKELDDGCGSHRQFDKSDNS